MESQGQGPWIGPHDPVAGGDLEKSAPMAAQDLWNSVYWKMPGVVFHYMDYIKHVKSGNANICTYPMLFTTLQLLAIYK